MNPWRLIKKLKTGNTRHDSEKKRFHCACVLLAHDPRVVAEALCILRSKQSQRLENENRSALKTLACVWHMHAVIITCKVARAEENNACLSLLPRFAFFSLFSPRSFDFPKGRKILDESSNRHKDVKISSGLPQVQGRSYARRVISTAHKLGGARSDRWEVTKDGLRGHGEGELSLSAVGSVRLGHGSCCHLQLFPGRRLPYRPWCGRFAGPYLSLFCRITRFSAQFDLVFGQLTIHNSTISSISSVIYATNDFIIFSRFLSSCDCEKKAYRVQSLEQSERISSQKKKETLVTHIIKTRIAPCYPI